MAYTQPTADDFKAYFDRDFPYAVPAVGAAGQAQLTVDAVTAINVTNPGSGYDQPPTVLLVPQNGGPGTGAQATVTVSAGSILAFRVTAAGAGYTLPPIVSMFGGAGDDTDLSFVRSKDLDRALLEASANFNPCLWESQAIFTMAFLYLAAHYLCRDMITAQQGLNSRYDWNTIGKHVGNVGEQFQVPAKVLQDPAFAYYSTTGYGAKYISLIMPRLIGNVGTHFRQTLP